MKRVESKRSAQRRQMLRSTQIELLMEAHGGLSERIANIARLVKCRAQLPGMSH
jgi:hypothetical protein